MDFHCHCQTPLVCDLQWPSVPFLGPRCFLGRSFCCYSGCDHSQPHLTIPYKAAPSPGERGCWADSVCFSLSHDSELGRSKRLAVWSRNDLYEKHEFPSQSSPASPHHHVARARGCSHCDEWLTCPFMPHFSPPQSATMARSWTSSVMFLVCWARRAFMMRDVFTGEKRGVDEC